MLTLSSSSSQGNVGADCLIPYRKTTYLLLLSWCSSLQGTEHLAEYFIGGIKMVRYKTDEHYSGLQTVIRLRHLFTTQVSWQVNQELQMLPGIEGC